MAQISLLLLFLLSALCDARLLVPTVNSALLKPAAMSSMPQIQQKEIKQQNRKNQPNKQTITNIPNLISTARMFSIPLFIGLQVFDKVCLSSFFVSR